MTNDGLNDEAGEGRYEPEPRELMNICPKNLENAAGVAVLECKSALNTEKSE